MLRLGKGARPPPGPQAAWRWLGLRAADGRVVLGEALRAAPHTWARQAWLACWPAAGPCQRASWPAVATLSAGALAAQHGPVAALQPRHRRGRPLAPGHQWHRRPQRLPQQRHAAKRRHRLLLSADSQPERAARWALGSAPVQPWPQARPALRLRWWAQRSTQAAGLQPTPTTVPLPPARRPAPPQATAAAVAAPARRWRRRSAGTQSARRPSESRQRQAAARGWADGPRLRLRRAWRLRPACWDWRQWAQGCGCGSFQAHR